MYECVDTYALNQQIHTGNFYRCTVHFKIYVVHTPTKELFFKFYIKIHINIAPTYFGL